MRIGAPAAFAVLAAGAAQAGTPIQPGLWEMVSKVETVSIPNAPPAVLQTMRGRPTTMRTCITPEQAAQGPKAIQQTDKSCTVGRYDMSGGRYLAEVVCKRPTGTMTARSVGAYTPTSFTAKSRMSGTGRMTMAMTTTVSGKRVGPCKG